jgi:uncharacterized membrane protein (Fun14 family)
MSFDNLGTVATSDGFGFMSGILMGFFMKKLLKIVAIIAGFITTVIASFQGIIRIDSAKLQTSSEWLVNALISATSSGIPGVITQQSLMDWGLPLTGGMAMGFGIGFMKG